METCPTTGSNALDWSSLSDVREKLSIKINRLQTVCGKNSNSSPVNSNTLYPEIERDAFKSIPSKAKFQNIESQPTDLNNIVKSISSTQNRLTVLEQRCSNSLIGRIQTTENQIQKLFNIVSYSLFFL